jgi:hypothetical protein
MLFRITIGEGNKETHKGLLTDQADNVFRRLVRLGLALGPLWRVFVGVALACLLGLVSLYAVSTGKRVETEWCRTFPIPR